ncbi:DNA mismatch repair protein MutS [Metamycoplasma buccale]|uniref:DNA mismatch repair protein MutS n=1 Tax=Metamycoplasma buccale TaxID=55602 RepID=UPI00398F8CA5
MWDGIKEIDLHGQDINKATATISLALFEFEQDDYKKYLDIIVGNGTGALKIRVVEILDKENYQYDYLNLNHSIIRVYKKTTF